MALSNEDGAVTKHVKECSKSITDRSAEESSYSNKETESTHLQNGDIVKQKRNEEDAHKYNHEILENGSATATSDLMSDIREKTVESATGARSKEKTSMQQEEHGSKQVCHDAESGAHIIAEQSSKSTAYSHCSTTDDQRKGHLDLGKLGEIKLSTKITSMDDLGASFLNADEEEDDNAVNVLDDMASMSSKLRTERFVESTVRTTMMGDGNTEEEERGDPPRRYTDDLVKRILAESQAPEKSKYKVSMGDEDEDSVSGYSSRYSSQGDRVIGSERKCSSDRSQSLFERRLESMGIEKELTDIMHTGAKRYEPYERRRPYSLSSDYGSLENDLDGPRSRYNGGGMYEDMYDGYGARGRFTRQRYIDDEEEELIPDEEFIPQKSADTDAIVKEKTDDIRGMVDRQNNVLKKLRSASESFDELSSEIRNIKQQFIENQARRTMIFDDIEYEAECSRFPQEPVGRYSKYGGYNDYDMPSPMRKKDDRTMAIDDDNESVITSNLGLATAQDDDTKSVYSCSYTAEKRNTGYGRSKSMFDEVCDDDFSPPASVISRVSRYDVDKPDGGLYGDDEEAPRFSGAYGGASGGAYGGTSAISSYSSGSYTPGSYTSSRLSGGSSYTSRYGKFGRSRTLPDVDTDVSEPAFSTSSSGFSSRFLTKVRQNKATGETPTTKRDKPFKSRFLNKSYDFPTPSSVYGSSNGTSSGINNLKPKRDDDSFSDISASTCDTAIETTNGDVQE